MSETEMAAINTHRLTQRLIYAARWRAGELPLDSPFFGLWGVADSVTGK